MSPAVKNGILLVVLLGVVITAGYFFTKGSPDETLPDDDASATTWICVNDSHIEKLTAKGVEEWMKTKMERSGRRMMVFMCPECNEYSIVRAQWCEEDDKFIPKTDLEGNSLLCPSHEAAMQGGG